MHRLIACISVEFLEENLKSASVWFMPLCSSLQPVQCLLGKTAFCE